MRVDTSDLHALPQLGEHVDRYRVIAELAQGGMAAVYVAHRQTAGFDKLFAMKVMLPHLRSDKQFAAMFLDEAQIGSQIQHPNVVQVFDVGDRDGSPFMVMELLRGKSMGQIMMLQKQKKVIVPRGLIYWVLSRVAEGLHAAHVAVGHDNQPLNVIHRDVSYQNIHVGYDGQVKIVDFGIADAEGRIAKTRTGEVMGKLQYMAPEQFHRKDPVDRRVDLWAMGVVAWRLLSGRRLFRGETDADTMWNVVHGDIPDIADCSAEPIPHEVARMIMACLNRNPNDRPSSAARISEVFHTAALVEGGGAQALANFMAGAFAEEKSREERALAQAMADPLAVSQDSVMKAMDLVRANDGSASITPQGQLASPSATGSSKRKKGAPTWLVATTVAFTLAAGAGVALKLTHKGMFAEGEGAAASAPALARESAPYVATALDATVEGEAAAAGVLDAALEREAIVAVALDAAATEVAATQKITIQVGVGVRLALVDGIRHDERPLVIELEEEGQVQVTLLTQQGAEKAWTIGVEDDGRALAVPEKVIPKKAPPKFQKKKKTKKKGGGELIEVPL